jgi:hypothetical protein
MTAEQLVKALEKQVGEMAAVEGDVLQLEDRRRELMLQLQIAESNLLTRIDGPINGKNAEVRAAQLLQETAPERIQINEFEREIARKKSELTYCQNLFKLNMGLLAFFTARPDLSRLGT